MIKNYGNILGNKSLDRLFVTGLLLLSFQFIHIGSAQLGHIWVIFMLFILVMKRDVRVSVLEAFIFVFFISVALIDTFFTEYQRYKSAEQIFKFVFLYPAFYLIGRKYGSRYSSEALPFTFANICVFLLIQYLLQFFEVPFLYQNVAFMQKAIHGTFLERNWIAIYFFFLAYMIFLKSGMRQLDVVKFIVFGVVVAFLSESKSIMICFGIVFLLQFRDRLGIKLLVLLSGSIIYLYRFGSELSGEALNVRLEQERGLAFDASVRLISENSLGYGFGFVESYFSKLYYSVMGLGLGVNSVFSSAVDFIIIAGLAGLLFWLVFFLGIGLRSFCLLAPVGAWSLINPLHQSEIVYLFIGYLVSWGLNKHESESSDKDYVPSSLQIGTDSTKLQDLLP